MNYFENTLNHLRLFGDRHAFGLSLPTAANARLWLERIENELSPENLTCDGELPYSQVMAKQKELLAAQKHCQSLLGSSVDEGAKDGMPAAQDTILASVARHLTNHPFDTATRIANRHFRAKRTTERRQKLHKAVTSGFTIGKRVVLSNGLRGTIVKINQTRVRVKTEDGRQWNVPPRCMELLKVR